MESQTSTAARYIQRRKRLIAQTDGGLILINSSGMSVDPSLRDKNLYYLTGCASPSACLLLAPQGVRVNWWESRKTAQVGRGEMAHEILFIEEPSRFQIELEGKAPHLKAIRAATGVEHIFGLSQMNAILSDALMDADTLWVNLPARPEMSEPPTPHTAWLKLLIQRFPWVRVRNIAAVIHAMRRIKDEYEIHCLKMAYQIQSEIFTQIMPRLKPGCNESLGEAIWEYETRLRGALGPAKESDTSPSEIIVAAGRNAAIAHYMSNRADIHDGDLVLIDSGFRYAGYTSDISRTFPANGRFTPRQRHLYEIVLEAQNLAIETMRPGSTQKIAHQAIYEHFKKHGLEDYGFGIYGHAVGLNIHDPGAMTRMDRDHPFQPGEVFAIEPFLSIPEERIGIRIEDGVLITATGRERLAGPPREVEEVGALCSI